MWPNPQENADLVTFAEEILNEKLNFFCMVEFKISCLYFSIDKAGILILKHGSVFRGTFRT